MKKLIIGPPGTGKTTTLLEIVHDCLSEGTPPERIAFTTFTKSGAGEAIYRAVDKFDIPKKRFINFKTLHSLCYRETGARKVMGYPDYKELSHDLGYNVTGFDEDDNGYSLGQTIRHVEEQARTRRIDIDEAAALLAPDINHFQIKHYQQTLIKFKAVHGVPDFTDLLEKFLTVGRPLDVDVMIIDEAQDLTELQWQVVEIMAQNATDVYYAGDDDQTVHVWAGASISRFMQLGKQCDEYEVLDHSYRLPRVIHEYANSLSSRIRNRYNKEWGCNGDEGFLVRMAHHTMSSLPLDNGEWLMLARNKRSLRDFASVLRGRGLLFRENGVTHLGDIIKMINHWERLRNFESISFRDVKSLYSKCFLRNAGDFDGVAGMKYTLDSLTSDFGLKTQEPWFDAFDKISLEDRKYLQACLRGGENSPRINVMTIHASKGREAQNVVLLSDCSRASVEELYSEPDSEHRVFYVGATRAKDSLYLVHESQENFYPL